MARETTFPVLTPAKPKRSTRSQARTLGQVSHQWQCSQCGNYFESDSPSQTCSNPRCN